MKKSVSPLIATVLLIAFTVAIGSVVMNWGTSYIKEEQVKATSTSDVRLTCATNVNLKLMKINNLQDYCYTNDSENVTISVRLTKGTEVLKGIRVNMISNSTSETHDYSQYVEDLNFNLKLTGFSTNVINENDLIEYVELVPYIDNNGESYFCSGSSLAITYLYPCGFEIDSPVIPSNPQDPQEPENPIVPEDPIDPEEPEETVNETQNETNPVSEYEDYYFVSVWNTSLVGTGSSASNQIKLPLASNGNYSFTADWGDGTQSYITTWNQEDVTHTYNQEGQYEIKINGTIVGFSFNNNGDKLKIKDIKQWGDLRLGNSGRYFYGTSNLNITATDVLNLEGTTTFVGMFDSSGVSNVSRIDEWDVSNITNMYEMFHNAKYFNSNISNWNVHNVKSMGFMFQLASSFNQPLDNWDIHNVTSMPAMFQGASSFNQPLNSWNVSNVIDIHGIFQGASVFNQPLDSWDVSNVKYMGTMFHTATSFNQSLNSWNVSNVIDMAYIFYYASSFNQPLDSWDVSNVNSMSAMFQGASSFNQPLDSWDVYNVTSMSAMFQGTSSFNQSLNDWNVSKVTTMGSMFNGASSFNQPLDSWDVSNVISMSFMFYGASSFNQPLDSWNVSKVTNMNSMFSSASSFNQNISNWCVTNITIEPSYFAYSSPLLSSYKPIWGTCPINLENEYNANQFVSVWNTSLVGTGSSASNQIKLPLESSGNYSFTVDWGDNTQNYITTYNDPNVIHTYDQQGEYEIKINGTITGFSFNNTGDKLKIRDIKQWGNLRLGNSGGYFYGTSNLNITATDILNLTGTTKLYQMFYYSGISNVSRINEWDVSSVTSMGFMFSNAFFFNQSLDNWNVSSVINMGAMFLGAFFFNQPLNNWDVSSVISMDSMFRSASFFNQPLDNWNVSSVIYMGYMFFSASSFNQNISNWCVNNITTEPSYFSYSSTLQSSYKPIWGTCPN